MSLVADTVAARQTDRQTDRQRTTTVTLAHARRGLIIMEVETQIVCYRVSACSVYGVLHESEGVKASAQQTIPLNPGEHWLGQCSPKPPDTLLAIEAALSSC